MLETYDKTPIFIPVDIKKGAVKSVARNISEVLALEVRTQKLYMGGF